MPYKDKDKQREASRKAQAKFKAKSKGITEQGITKNQSVIPQVITDVCRTEHLIDYEGRRKDWDSRGWLAKQYSIINGFEDKDGRLTQSGRYYLGLMS